MDKKATNLISESSLLNGFTTDDLETLQQIARDQVIEPFAGKKGQVMPGYRTILIAMTFKLMA